MFTTLVIAVHVRIRLLSLGPLLPLLESSLVPRPSGQRLAAAEAAKAAAFETLPGALWPAVVADGERNGSHNQE